MVRGSDPLPERRGEHFVVGEPEEVRAWWEIHGRRRSRLRHRIAIIASATSTPTTDAPRSAAWAATHPGPVATSKTLVPTPTEAATRRGSITRPAMTPRIAHRRPPSPPTPPPRRRRGRRGQRAGSPRHRPYELAPVLVEELRPVDGSACAFHAHENSRRPSIARATRCCIGLAARINVARERGAGSRAVAVVGADERLLAREHARCVFRVPRRGRVRATARCRRPP